MYVCVFSFFSFFSLCFSGFPFPVFLTLIFRHLNLGTTLFTNMRSVSTYCNLSRNLPRLYPGITKLISCIRIRVPLWTVAIIALLTYMYALQKRTSSNVLHESLYNFNSHTSSPGVCSNSSAWVKKRASEAVDVECHAWLTSEEPVDTFISQFGQDAFMFFNFFRCMDGPGTYLDLGAFHPRSISNTWFLDKCLGWRGMCIEGNPEQAAPFRTERSCHVIDKVVSTHTGSTQFIRGATGGHVVFGDSSGGDVLKSTTLADALDETTWGRESRVLIDFLSLDVEFHELDVLVALPWERLDIRFAAIENNKNTLDNWEYLMRFGFVKVASIAVDDIFMRSVGARSLWLPQNIDNMRIKESSYRRDFHKTPTYLNSALYSMGWNAFLKYVDEHGTLPSK